MNKDYPPLVLPDPFKFRRRTGKGMYLPLEDEVITLRKEIARALSEQLDFVSRKFRSMTEEERRAVFFKLEHNGKVKVSGVGLKVIAENEHVTIAVPNKETIKLGEFVKFSTKLEEFGEGELTKGQPLHPELARLTSIKEGEPKDRLSQQMFDDYDSIIHSKWIIFEIELLSLLQGRSQQKADLEQIRVEIQNTIAPTGTIFEHEDSGRTCRLVIGCDGPTFQRLVEDAKWQVKVSWFENRPHFQTFHTTLEEFEISKLGKLESPDETAPIVCIIDSGINHGNPFLEPVTKEDLLMCFLNSNGDDEYGPNDEVVPDGHGSGVASLAAYHSINLAEQATNKGHLWITGARVLDENCEVGNRLFSKMLREVVETYVKHGIKIFNLSVNDIDKRWHEDTKRNVPRNSWIARSVDNLSREFDVVFVVSSGNIDEDDIDTFLVNGDTYPDYFQHDHTSILDPAQAALAITVGAISPSTLAVGSVAGLSALADANHPSPFTRRGPGINKEIKPELVEHGGNYLIDQSNSTIRNPGTSIIMASNKLTPAITWSVGTSFAAPKVTHKLGLVLADLKSIGIKEPSAALLKALIVNSASYDFLNQDFAGLKQHFDGLQSKLWLNVLGHGIPSDFRATYCDEHSALMFFQGVMIKDEISYFSIPIPQSLANSGQGIKRLSITLAYDSEVQSWGLEDYLGMKVKWKIFRGNVNPEDVVFALSSDEEIEAPNELSNPRIGISLRSRGSIQHDVYEWERHQESYSENAYTLAVIPQSRWSRNVSSARFGLVVRVEDTSRTTPIYSDIQNVLTSIELPLET